MLVLGGVALSGLGIIRKRFKQYTGRHLSYILDLVAVTFFCSPLTPSYRFGR
ncbi:MAG: hypothetical protein JXB10_06265 [Pirellulales bacterium]|nr:hypothetical protein [Pirellulales bacterium]